MNGTQSDETEYAFDLSTDDVGETAVVRYQSVFHPNADKTEVRGEIEQVGPRQFFIETDDGRILEVTDRSVLLNTDADGRHLDKKIGEDPEFEVKRLYEVYVTGVKVKNVRAEDEEKAREKAQGATDYGEMYDSTDVNAASRVDDARDDGEVVE